MEACSFLHPQSELKIRATPDYFLHSNSLNSATTLLKGSLCSMSCLNVLSSVASCFTLPLSKAGQLIHQSVASSYLRASAGWWAARVIGRESSEGDECTNKETTKCTNKQMKILNQDVGRPILGPAKNGRFYLEWG